MAKVRTGDDRPLAPMRGWQVLHRSVFGLEHAGHRYDVEVLFLDDEARLYTDGRQTARSWLPARFPVPGGRLEVAATTYGLKRMHLVLDDGTTAALRPARGTAERWRAELGHRHPALDRWLARGAVLVLLVGLVVALPALAELVTGIEVVADLLGGSFTSPFALPAPVSTTLTVAGVAAAVERGLTLRNHWLIDLDTSWLD